MGDKGTDGCFIRNIHFISQSSLKVYNIKSETTKEPQKNRSSKRLSGKLKYQKKLINLKTTSVNKKATKNMYHEITHSHII
jgi:hypothetical protein